MTMLFPQVFGLLVALLASLSSFSTADRRSTAEIAPYGRGKGFKFFLSEAQRERGATSIGSAERLRVVMQKLAAGEKIHVVTLGGSVTAGLHGIGDGHSWPQYLFNWLNDTYPGQVKGTNGAVPGTISAYMSVCLNIHAPKDADIVLVEYSVNDVTDPVPFMVNEFRRSYERLLRKLLTFPNNPAVILMHSYNWFFVPNGIFWTNCEREFGEMALYYNLPQLSVKACCFQDMLKGKDGFYVERYRSQDPKGLAGRSFYYDRIHPDALTGSRAMGDLAIHLLMQVTERLAKRPLADTDKAAVAEPLPIPMIPDNYQSTQDKCFIGDVFQSKAVKRTGFEWLNDATGKAKKYGFIATKKHSELHFLVDTRATAKGGNVSTSDAGMEAPVDLRETRKEAQPEPDADQKVQIQLLYLKSYQHMGDADIRCESGCECKPSILKGHNSQRRTSLLHLHGIMVTQSKECLLTVHVRPQTESGEYKVKISGMIVSEETGMGHAPGSQTFLEAIQRQDRSAKKTGSSRDGSRKRKPTRGASE